MAQAIEPSTHREHPAVSQRKRRWRTFLLAGLVCAAWSSLSGWSDSHAFVINASTSLPNWAFLIAKNKVPQRGDYVFFASPKTPLIVAHFGKSQGPFGKIIFGMPGDQVDREGGYVRVNGVRVAHLKPFTRWGETLIPGPTGTVPSNCYFVATHHPDGFDSRYADIGFVCRKALIGTGVSIL